MRFKGFLTVSVLMGYLLSGYASTVFADALTDFKAARAAENKGDYDEAIRLYTKALNSGDFSTRNQGKAYYYRGNAYKSKGAYDRAIENYNEVIRLNPGHARAYYNRGSTYGSMGACDRAIENFNEVIRLKPDHAGAYYNRGSAYFCLSRFGKAVEDFEQVGLRDPKDVYAMFGRFIAAGRQGQDGKSVLKFQSKVVDLSKWPGHVVSFYLGELTEESFLGKAQSDDRKTTNEQNCEAYFYLGQHYLIQGDTAKAKNYFQKSLDTGVTSFVEYSLAKAELERM